MPKTARRKSSHRRRSHKGGDGVADNAIRVYGNMANQARMSPTDNTIMMRAGKKHRSSKKRRASRKMKWW
jgi:hypothetical protein